MVKPFPTRFSGGDEGKLVQTKYWLDIGGYGLSLDHLKLVGFIPEEMQRKMEVDGTDTRQTIEQFYGGILKFRPLPGKQFEARLDRVIDDLNRVLQFERHVDATIAWIKGLFSEKWHDDSERSYLPEDLPENLKELIKIKPSYVISEDPITARQILAALPILEGLKNWKGYFSGLYREAQSVFQRMVLESVSMSMTNMALTKPDAGPTYIDLEEAANMATEAIMDGGP